MKVWRREPRPQKKRRRALWVLVFSVIILGAGAYGVLASPALRPQEIVVTGNEKILKAAIQETIPRRSLVLLGEGVAQALREKFPSIRDVKIERDFLKRTLRLTVEEREGIGIYCGFSTSSNSNPSTSSGSTNYSSSEPFDRAQDKLRESRSCAVVDRDGVIFEEALAAEGGLVLLFKDFEAGESRFGSQVMEPRLVQELSRLKEDALGNFGTIIKSFLLNQERPGEVTAETAEGWLIYLDPKQSAQEITEILRKILAEQIKENRPRLEYVDLRIENRVYYKLK